MILRIDRLGTELPPPSSPDPNGASAVQEPMGGKSGEMSTERSARVATGGASPAARAGWG